MATSPIRGLNYRLPGRASLASGVCTQSDQSYVVSELTRTSPRDQGGASVLPPSWATFPFPRPAPPSLAHPHRRVTVASRGLANFPSVSFGYATDMAGRGGAGWIAARRVANSAVLIYPASCPACADSAQESAALVTNFKETGHRGRSVSPGLRQNNVTATCFPMQLRCFFVFVFSVMSRLVSNRRGIHFVFSSRGHV